MVGRYIVSQRAYRAALAVLGSATFGMVGLAGMTGLGILTRWPELCAALLLAGLLPVHLATSLVLRRLRRATSE